MDGSKIIGYTIRFIHIIIIIITVAIPFIPKISTSVLIGNTLLLIVILLLFIYNNGCIVSRYERTILKDEWTPIDILIVEPTRQSRKSVSFYFLIFLILVSCARIFRVLYVS